MEPKNHILWLICGGVALALHAGAAALFYGESNRSDSSKAVGQKGVLVELTFEGAAAGGRSQVGNVEEKTAAVASKVENVQPKKAQQESPKKAEPKAAPVKNMPVKKPPSKFQPTKTEAVSSAPLAPAEQQPADSVAANNNVGLDQGAEVEAVTHSVGGAGGKNAAALGTRGEGNVAQSGGAGGAIKSYEDLVQVWVHKHLLYPKSARRRQLTGTVIVRFTLAPEGHLIASEIVEESAFKILNKSALKTIKRAAPFPIFPKEIKGKSRVFTIPIEYKTG